MKEQAYIALVRSTLEYCSAIRDPYLQKEKDQIEKVQWRASRVVKRDFKRTTSVMQLLSDLGWESLEERRRKARLILFYKVANKMVGGVPTDKLVKCNERTRGGQQGNYQHI